MTALAELENLQLAAVRYRSAVDHIFSPSLTTSENWRACLAGILVSTTRLYLGYLLVAEGLEELEALVSKKRIRKSFPTDTVREMKLRAELGRKLELPTSWPGFIPYNPFSDITRLRTLKDYTASFTLHLPEIYEETFRIEACAKSFLADRNSSVLAQLLVGLQHLGRNHASFVLPALEWAADEGSWDKLVEGTRSRS
ncbi:hypothetical protein HDF16_001015 [Granulicella aggregans]|uniref:Uncharacterized protein n=1 Tax=Granulicella aggregans TaxID=474949 RepID=A0A7W7ZAI6_9BACT|nr:hypothetical protein [Granulicella aggregans]MBB5056346.1 hypothetical protein [Granulicella aggregans]